MIGEGEEPISAIVHQIHSDPLGIWVRGGCGFLLKCLFLCHVRDVGVAVGAVGGEWGVHVNLDGVVHV